MPLKKIEIHEVDTDLRQAKESTDAVRGMQEELENVLATYNDNSKRYAAGEIAREEFQDLTHSKEEAVRDINAKVKNNVGVILTSLEAIRRVTVVQEPADEAAEKEVTPHKHAAMSAAKPHKAVKHKAAKHHAKKK